METASNSVAYEQCFQHLSKTSQWRQKNEQKKRKMELSQQITHLAAANPGVGEIDEDYEDNIQIDVNQEGQHHYLSQSDSDSSDSDCSDSDSDSEGDPEASDICGEIMGLLKEEEDSAAINEVLLLNYMLKNGSNKVIYSNWLLIIILRQP